MGTVTVTSATFAALPGTAPANWPSDVVYPAGANTNGTRTVTVSDGDWLMLLTWLAASQPQFRPVAPATQSTPTGGQLLLAWPNVWINGTKQAVQQFHTVPAVVPPPISMT